MTFDDLVPLLGVGIEGLVGLNKQTPETQCGRRVFTSPARQYWWRRGIVSWNCFARFLEMRVFLFRARIGLVSWASISCSAVECIGRI